MAIIWYKKKGYIQKRFKQNSCYKFEILNSVINSESCLSYGAAKHHGFEDFEKFSCLKTLPFFSAVHSVCLWDDKGPQKMYKALQDDILDFIRHAQAVSAFT